MTKLQRRLCTALEAHLDGGRPRPPEGASTLWNGFTALSRARSCGPVGPNPISYPEIAAWALLMRVPLEPRHVDILTAMDQIWMERAYLVRRVPDGTKGLPPRSSHKMTPAMFDTCLG